MSFNPASRRAKPRWLLALGAVGAMSVLVAGVALGALLSDFDTEDGNLKVDDVGEMDWAGVTEVRKDDAPSGSGDDSFTQGTKEDTGEPVTETGSIPPNKSDLKTFGVYVQETGAGKFVHLYWTRVQDPSGTTNMDFEFNQSKTLAANGVTPVRTAGDLLITYELSRGGTVPNLFLLEWLTAAGQGTCDASNAYPCWGNRTDLDAAGAATGSINEVAIPELEADGLGALSARTFGEATIDLDFVFDETKCTSFGSAYLKSRSSDSFTSALKDFIAPTPVNLTNCATVIVRKVTDPAGDTQSFGFTKSFATDPTEADTFSLADGESQTYDGVLFGTGLTVTEDSPLPAGWDLTSIDCSASTGVTPSVNEETGTVTFDIDNASDKLDCTYTNTARGNIIVQKQTDPDGDPQVFAFTADYDADGFSLSDDEQNDSGPLVPGTYSVSETVPDGWDQESATCDDGSDPGAIGLGAGETVTCTFTNEKDAFIIVDKVTFPSGDPQSFAFTASYDADGFSLTDAADPNNSGDLDPGTYSVAETVPSGWDLTSATCSDGSAPGSISLAAGETVTCTFTNTKRGTIVVDKVTIPAGETQSFSFDASGGTDPAYADFNLTDVADPNSQVLKPGSYSVAETVPDGWDLTSLSCSDASGGTTTDLGTKTASISLAAGETVTCTFTNTKRGTIIVDKETVPAGEDQLFDFAASWIPDVAGTPDFQLADGTTPHNSGYLVPGSYSVSETAPAGWQQTSATCTDGSDPGSINLGAGETVTCTFTNTKLATITIEKQTDPDLDTTSFAFAPDYTDAFSLADGESDTSAYLNPGSYSVTETVPTGWDLTGLVCTDPDDGSTTDLETATASIDLDAGENVTCTFTNTKRGAITIEKADDAGAAMAGVDFTLYVDVEPLGGTEPDAGDLAGTPAGSCTTDAAGTCTISNLLPDVSYWVVEEDLDGYLEPDPYLALVEPGQTVTVARVNTRLFQIVTFVCKSADDSLYVSTADDGSGGIATLAGVPEALALKGVTAADLCALAANFGDKVAGDHQIDVSIPVQPQ